MTLLRALIRRIGIPSSTRGRPLRDSSLASIPHYAVLHSAMRAVANLEPRPGSRCAPEIHRACSIGRGRHDRHERRAARRARTRRASGGRIRSRHAFRRAHVIPPWNDAESIAAASLDACSPSRTRGGQVRVDRCLRPPHAPVAQSLRVDDLRADQSRRHRSTRLSSGVGAPRRRHAYDQNVIAEVGGVGRLLDSLVRRHTLGAVVRDDLRRRRAVRRSPFGLTRSGPDVSRAPLLDIPLDWLRRRADALTPVELSASVIELKGDRAVCTSAIMRARGPQSRRRSLLRLEQAGALAGMIASRLRLGLRKRSARRGGIVRLRRSVDDSNAHSRLAR